MRNTNEKSLAGGKKGAENGRDGIETTGAYEAVDRLERDFTAVNFSKVPLAFMKAGLKGELDHRQLTANFRGLETAFKPVEAAISIKRLNAALANKGHDSEAAGGDLADKFLGASQIKPQLGQK